MGDNPGHQNDIWKSLRESPVSLGALLYGWFSLLGMSYSWSFYDVFNIDIFHFAEPSDFLIFALSEVAFLAGSLITLLAVSLAISIFVVIYFAIYIPFFTWLTARVIVWNVKIVLKIVSRLINRVFPFEFSPFESFLFKSFPFKSFLSKIPVSVPSLSLLIFEAYKRLRAFVVHPIFLCSLIVLLFISSVYGSLALGHYRGQGMLRGTQDRQNKVFLLTLSEWVKGWLAPYKTEMATENGRRCVRVTIRREGAQLQTPLPIPDRTFLIGKTNSFHFLYECENQLHCENGRPFVVPTVNLASLEFSRRDSPSTSISLRKQQSQGGEFGPVAPLSESEHDRSVCHSGTW